MWRGGPKAQYSDERFDGILIISRPNWWRRRWGGRTPRRGTVAGLRAHLRRLRPDPARRTVIQSASRSVVLRYHVAKGAATRLPERDGAIRRGYREATGVVWTGDE